MRLIVNPHKIKIVRDEQVNEKELNVSECNFEFNEEITDDFVKEALFTFKGTTYKQIITDNKCSFPSEVLKEKGQVEIGVVAYKVIDETTEIRYNPSPAYFNTLLGSMKDKIENSEEITPTDKEQIESQLANKQDRLVSGVNIKTINHESLLGEGNIRITGEGGTADYEDLDNKPSINNVELNGNKTLGDLGIQPAGSYALASDIPTNLSELTDDTTHRLVTDTEKITWNNKSDFSGSYNDLTNKPTLFSGDYDDLTNKPSIPTKISDLTDDSNFLESTDLKTINGNSLVGSGDITISSGEKPLMYYLETDLTSTSDWGTNNVLSNNDLNKLSSIINDVYNNGKNFFTLIITSENNKKTPITFTYTIYSNRNIQTKPTQLELYSIQTEGQLTPNFLIKFKSFLLSCNITWNGETPTVTFAMVSKSEQSFLATNNNSSYTPTSNYQPATKKYVDDSIASAITTTLSGNY